MQATPSNILVDLREALSPEYGDDLVSELGGIEGVRRAWVSPRARRIVLVDYDPTITDTQRILGTVVRHGFDARLVGM